MLAAISEDWAAVILVPIIAILGIWFLVRREKRKTKMLNRWAAEQGVRLIDRDERGMVRGPYFWGTAGGQVVYRVAAEFPGGEIRHGWVRLGTWPVGLLSNEVDVKWDVPKKEPPGFPVILRERTGDDAGN
jgi:hypothetical protein